MQAEAIAKLKNEMEAHKSNGYIKEIGDFLINLVEKVPQVAEKILINEKSISKSLGAMRKEAEKHKIDGTAALAPVEGFKIVLAYFGINGDAIQPAIQDAMKETLLASIMGQRGSAPPQTLASSANDFNVNLDDLL